MLRQIPRRQTVPSLKSLDEAEESYLVACELGLHAKFIQHLCTPLNLAFPKIFGLQKYRFGDVQATETSSEAGERLIPDFAVSILSANSAPQLILVGELKCFWTLDLNPEQPDLQAKLEKPLGQLGAYMNSFGLKYGFLSTYSYTEFVRRDDNYRWSISAPVKRDAQNPSLRECLLYIVWLAKTNGHEFTSGLPNQRVVLGQESGPASDRPSTSRDQPYQMPTGSAEEPSGSRGKAADPMLPTEQLTRLQLSGDSTFTGVGGRHKAAPVKENVKPKSLDDIQIPPSLSEPSSLLDPPALKPTAVEFRMKDTGSIDTCQLLDEITVDKERAVYHCSWGRKNAVLKWWDQDEEFAEWRFKNECTARSCFPNSRYIPAIYAAGEVVRGPLNPGFIILMEFREGEIFSPWHWSRMDGQERGLFVNSLRDAFRRFRERNLTHHDAQANVLWDTETSRLCVIDWEECTTMEDYKSPESYEIHSIMTGCIGFGQS
ncbi:hypothetical protein Dda_1778 [Drechslerella dactyloides]|uniref:Uncharacterized protein n=1 Tax=Drechslerella dactyloides TaxID=74499 RepID=A0AAD6J6N5_DREDA|nr:hypothetical protein Dda_1778 [Drechslerella dactyloides]